MSSYHPGATLPAPVEAQIAHSSRLIETLIQQIDAAGGVISFRDYMQACLYQPGLGYYAAGATKFGEGGDFITAPEVSALFGRTWARRIARLFAQGLKPQLLEFGAGSGRLALDIVSEFEAQSVDWQGYFILETSADLQQRQRQLLQQHLPSPSLQKIHWLQALPQAFSGMVIANEVLDAMPVNVVLKDGDWIELGVGFEEGKLIWKAFSRNSDAVQRIRAIDDDNDLPQQYCTEVNLNFPAWFEALSRSCHEVTVEFIDYGYQRAQYYHPHRSSGTLQCFYRHRSHPDPFIYPGLQDITAFVDFDAVADAAIDAGFSLQGMMSQAQFLMQNGLLDAIPHSDDEMQQLALAQQIKTLTLPGEMGEKFKVITMSKKY